MSPTPSFLDLLNKLEAGSVDGPGEVIRDRFENRLIGLAVRRIGQRPNRRTDAEDVVQSAFGTFFKRVRLKQYKFHCWEELWGLLGTIAIRRVKRAAARANAAKRGGGWADAGPVENVSLDREPLPEEVVIAEAVHDELLARTPEHHRRALEMSLDGYTAEEVARATELSLATVERIRRRAREHLTEILSREPT